MTSRSLRRRSAAVAAIGAVAAAVVGTGGGAHAANPTAQTGVLFNQPTASRTLTLVDGAGNPLTASSNLDASKPQTPFSVKVSDSNYSLNGYLVTSSMSDLYQYSNGTYTCANKMPSSAVTASFLAGSSAVEQGVSATLNPVFNITGTITNAVAGAQTAVDGIFGLLVGQTPSAQQQVVSSVNTDVDGTLAGTALNASTLLGATAPNLVNGLLAQLPLNAANGAGGNYAAADVAPSGSSCTDGNSATASQVPLQSGSGNLSGLLNALKGILAQVNGLSGLATGSVPLSSLISAGYVTDTQVSDALGQVLTATPIVGSQLYTALGGNAPGSVYETIVSDLTATLVTAKSTVDGITGLINPLINGDYLNSPNLTVTPPANTPAGTYRGEMTVTLMDTTPPVAG